LGYQHQNYQRVELSHNFFVQWHLTDRCNLRCRHCYQSPKCNRKSKTLKEFTTDEVCSIIKELRETKELWEEEYKLAIRASLHFTGGEPFLRQDLFYLIKEAKKAGFSIYVLSNGTLINPQHAASLAALAVDGVQVSIEGTEKIHDGVRGKGAFVKALAGIDELLRAGVKVGINVTLSRINIGEILPVVQLAEKLGLAVVGFSRFVPYGIGQNLIQSMLSPQELREALSYIKKLGSKAKVRVVCHDPLMSLLEPWQRQAGAYENYCLGVFGCCTGVSGITFLSEGTVLPCRRLNVPIGNIRTDSFRKIWANSPVLWRLRRQENYHGKCQVCKNWAFCKGCRAVAFAVSLLKGEYNYLAEDPQCWQK
jgi:radical SAM protein with 4Fe4S-binding SPASM domain